MNLDKKSIERDVSQALDEDLGSGDLSASLLPKDLMVEAKIISREAMLVCGQAWVEGVFHRLNPEIQIHWLVKEGAFLAEPQTLCLLKGLSRDILTGERSALNFLQTLSGTATKTYTYVQALKGSKTKLLDTRKTIPGLRYAQKYAVRTAGGYNHRLGLYDAFLIKENHIKSCGSITQAIVKAKAQNLKAMIEVEVETLSQLQEALIAKPDRILLDNFSLDLIRDAVLMAKPYRCLLEASGGIDLANIKEIAETGVDYISVGSITKSIQAIDLSLLIRDLL